MSGSGDGYKECSDGNVRWGLFGAAGILFFTNAGAEPRFFLVHRTAETHGGVCWGIPGGAADEGEQPLAAAWREAGEELPGLAAQGQVEHLLRGESEFAPASDWSYTTFVVELEQSLDVLTETDWDASEQTWETQDAAWFSRAQIESLDLHPGLAAVWASGQLGPFLSTR